MQSMCVSLKMSRLFFEYIYGRGVHCPVKMGSEGLKYCTLYRPDIVQNCYHICSTIQGHTKRANSQCTSKNSHWKDFCSMKDFAHSQHNQTSDYGRKKKTARALFSHTMQRCL